MTFAPGDLSFTSTQDLDKWKFDKGMKKGNGVLKLRPFEIPGLPWQFCLRMCETRLRYQVSTSDEEDYENDKDDSIGWYNPTELTIDGDLVKPISHFFSAQLCVENPEVMPSELRRLELCGFLDMYQTSAGSRYRRDTIKGVMYAPGCFFEERSKDIRTGYIGYSSYSREFSTEPLRLATGSRPGFNGWLFGTKTPTLLDKHVHVHVDPANPWESGITFEPDVYRDFYTVGKVPRLVLELKIGIPNRFKEIFPGLA